jgi:hypothetical protein
MERAWPALIEALDSSLHGVSAQSSAASRLLVVRLNGICIIPSSIVMTADHYLETSINQFEVPPTVLNFILEHRKLFIDYNILDMEFRHLYFRLFGPRKVAAARGKCVIVQDERIIVTDKAEEQAEPPSAAYERKIGAAATWNVVRPGENSLPGKLNPELIDKLGAEVIDGRAVSVLHHLEQELER